MYNCGLFITGVPILHSIYTSNNKLQIGTSSKVVVKYRIIKKIHNKNNSKTVNW